jgi:hypothetical protein
MAGANGSTTPLKLLTYLAPAIPMAAFERVGAVLGERLGRDVTVSSITSQSGPGPDGEPLTGGGADLAFVCAPS